MPLIKDIKGIYLIQRINIEDEGAIYYVGQSVGIFNRWKQHCNGNQQNIDKAIQQFGLLNFTFTILEVVSKTADLHSCETKWINTFKGKGEKYLYNISQTDNPNPHLIDAKTKNEIKNLFEEEIGRSIYAIAEKYEIGFNEVISIRKPLLKAKGLSYNMREKNIVDSTGERPENWKGNRVTKNMADKIISLQSQGLDNDDIAYECNISIIDLKIFFEEYAENKDNLEFAEPID
jgi:group I intron endonuclease